MVAKVITPLKDEVEAILHRDALLRDFPIEVIDHNGLIILEGKVPSDAISAMAEGLARQVDGVISVSNELYIRAL